MMGYFSYLADQSFKTAANGERLFFECGTLFRPYILPDAATEQRVRRKRVWLLRGMLFGVWLTVVFLPETFKRDALIFLGIMAALVVVDLLINRLVLASELRGLHRADQRIPLSDYYEQMARKHSLTALVLGFVGALAFVALGLALTVFGQGTAVGVICAVFFAIASLGWAYAIVLKCRHS